LINPPSDLDFLPTLRVDPPKLITQDNKSGNIESIRAHNDFLCNFKLPIIEDPFPFFGCLYNYDDKGKKTRIRTLIPEKFKRDYYVKIINETNLEHNDNKAEEDKSDQNVKNQKLMRETSILKESKIQADKDWDHIKFDPTLYDNSVLSKLNSTNLNNNPFDFLDESKYFKSEKLQVSIIRKIKPLYLKFLK